MNKKSFISNRTQCTNDVKAFLVKNNATRWTASQIATLIGWKPQQVASVLRTMYDFGEVDVKDYKGQFGIIRTYQKR